MGLSITKHLANFLGGYVDVKSEKGKGSTFRLVIPAGIDDTKTSLPDKYENEDNMVIGKEKFEQLKFSGHILVAEDVKTNQMLITSLLNRMGIKVTISADGREAVQKVLSSRFDLIFMDIQMPNMDGCEAIKILRKEGIKIPIIAMTAYTMKGDEQKCIEIGCDGYLSKPIDRIKLIETIQRYLPLKEQVLNNEFAQSQVGYPSKSCYDMNLQIPGIDTDDIINMDNLLARFGDESLLEEDNEDHYEKLAEAIKSRDCRAIMFHAHAIKGAGRNLEVKKMADIASTLEDAGRKGDIERAIWIFNDLKPEFEKVVSFLLHSQMFQKSKKFN